jgi:hypothetical protein
MCRVNSHRAMMIIIIIIIIIIISHVAGDPNVTFHHNFTSRALVLHPRRLLFCCLNEALHS